MAEYIEREAAVSNLELLARHEDRFRQSVILGVVDTIRAMEAADVAPVVHGRWRALRKYDARRTYRCSVCGRTIRLSLAIDINEYAPYCNCGARMDGGEDGKTD